MSLVNNETLNQIRSQRQRAKDNSSWEASYQLSMRGLEAAIALLEQIDHTTKDLVFETKITLHKG